MRTLICILVVLVALLQYRLWIAEDGMRDLWRLERAAAEKRESNGELARRNRLLAAEVADLKEGLDAVEERARGELGLIADGETFYQTVVR